MKSFNRKNLVNLLLPLSLMSQKIDASENIVDNNITSNFSNETFEDGNNSEDDKLFNSENFKFKKKYLKKLMTKYFPPYLILMNQLDIENPQLEDESKTEYRNFNVELFNNLKKIRRLGKGMQGSTYLYENNITHARYVLKRTRKENLPYLKRTIYEEFPEFLACEKLKDFKCEYIAKPLAYRQISDNYVEILLEYAKNNVSLDSLTIQERKKVLKQILFARKELQKIGLIHGDICRKNFNIEKKKDGNLKVHIYDYGYFSEIKDSYSEKDIIMYMHPFIDVQQIYKSIESIFNKKTIEILNKNVKKELPNLYNLVSKETWEIKNRKKYAPEMLKISLDDCNRFIDIVDKWVDEINA